MDRDSSPERRECDERRGGAFYDDPGVFERYRAHREWVENPNLVMEEPALLDELASVSGLRVLDLGCGDASTGRLLLHAGVQSYVGVDGSSRMIDAARTGLTDDRVKLINCDIEDFQTPSASFDLILSRMALHYLERIDPVIERCHNWLVPGGRIVFTVTHPAVTSNDARASTDEPREDWVIDNYFATGARDQKWLGGQICWYHRTIENYVQSLRDADFQLTNVRECAPSPERFENQSELMRRQRIPLFLLLSAQRQ